jgi:hypothetical protein
MELSGRRPVPSPLQRQRQRQHLSACDDSAENASYGSADNLLELGLFSTDLFLDQNWHGLAGRYHASIMPL